MEKIKNISNTISPAQSLHVKSCCSHTSLSCSLRLGNCVKKLFSFLFPKNKKLPERLFPPTRLTKEQIDHNLEVDLMILQNKIDYEKECSEMEGKRRKFYEENPDFWSKNMFIMVTAPKQVGAIKYVYGYCK